MAIFFMKNKYFLLFLVVFALQQHWLLAQKTVALQSLDQIKGLFFVPNTPAPFEGLATEEYPDGTRIEVPIKAGKIEGIVLDYGKMGKKRSETPYQKGIKNGLETQWHESGKKKLAINYVNGLADGICTEWHDWRKVEQKKSEGLFRQGKEQGTHVWWHANGKIDQQATYENGLLNGALQQWYDNGQLRSESQFRNGKREGTITEWFEMGLKKSEGTFSDDKENGIIRNWARNGELIGVRHYEMGKLVSEENYQSGSIRTARGYLEIFNEPQSSFSVEIVGDNVKPRKANVPTYVANGTVVQFFIAPYPATDPSSASATLESFQQKEITIIKNALGTEELDVTTQRAEITVQQKKIPSLYWYFQPPPNAAAKNKDKTVQREDYLSLLCPHYILSLYGLTTAANSPQNTEELLRRIAATLLFYDKKVDLTKATH